MPVAPDGAGDSATLTAAQHLLLAAGSRIDEPGLATMFYALELAGDLDDVRLASCWHETVQAHPALRTSYTPLGGGFRARVLDTAHLNWRSVGAAGYSDADIGLLATRERDRHMSEAFQVEAGELARATLIRLRPERHILLASFHHASIDGWSLDLFCEEVSARYGGSHRSAVNRTAASSLERGKPPEPRQELERWWSARLADLPASPATGASGLHATSLSRAFARIPDESTGAFKAWIRRSRTSLHAAFLVLLGAVLEALSVEGASTIGTLIANRTPSDRGFGSGALYEALLLRAPCRIDAGVSELAREMMEEIAEAVDHFLPYEAISRIAFGKAREAPPRVVFQTDHYPLSLLRFPNTRATPLPMTTGSFWPVGRDGFDWEHVREATPSIRAVGVADLTVFARSWRTSLGITAFAGPGANPDHACGSAALMAQAVEIVVGIPDISYGELVDRLESLSDGTERAVEAGVACGGTLVEHLSPVPLRPLGLGQGGWNDR